LKKLGSDNIVEVVGKNGQLIVVPVKLGTVGETDSEILEPSLLRPTDQIVLGIALGSKSIRESSENLELKATATPGLNLSPKP
jgi:multidrug efflux pump subunit AcrA (membrane-fusion protein)